MNQEKWKWLIQKLSETEEIHNYIPCMRWKLAFYPKILKIHIFDVTDYNKYVVESPELVIRRLLSIHIEREKSVKALKHEKHIFWPKTAFFHPNLRTLIMYALASFRFGFRRSNISKNDENILCICQNHILVEFLQTTKWNEWIETCHFEPPPLILKSLAKALYV